MRIGVLALQGDFKEHCDMLLQLGIAPKEVRTKEDLKSVDGLIIPGGESTTIGKLMVLYGLDSEIKKRNQKGMPIYGTCAGAILLAKEIIGSDQPTLDLADISIARNAYGRQIDSFEADITIEKKPYHAIFIRAPVIKKIGKSVKILAKHKNEPVLLQDGNILLSTFHPELTNDPRIHKYFLSLVKK